MTQYTVLVIYMKKTILAFFLLLFLSIASITIQAQEEQLEEDTVTTTTPDLCKGSTAAILIETRTKTILFNK